MDESKVNRYYCPGAAEFAAKIIGKWKELNYAPQSINCGPIQLTNNSLYQKMHYGLMWLKDNATADTKEFWTKIYETTHLRRRAYSVEIYRVETDNVFTPIAEKRFTSLMADFESWVHADPVFKARWPTTDDPITLTPEHIEHFTRRREELKAANFWTVARIRTNELLFVRVPPPVGLEGKESIE